MNNQFCDKSDLKDESDVEQFFVIRLLTSIGYKDSSIKTKKSLGELAVGKGSKKENYKPDYVLINEKKPKIVLDAKSPEEKIEDWTYQVSGYALGLNKKFKGENPVRYTILTNGFHFNIYNWDEEEPVLTLKFEDFVKDNKKFDELKKLISFEEIIKDTGKNEISIADFLSKPSVEEIKSAFNKCHNLIWKKQKISPTDAFYEFSKVIFVKLNEDKRLRKIIESGTPLKKSDFKFSVDWLNDREGEAENPMSSILFHELQKKLEEEVQKNNKKPIFSSNEGIELWTDTIREVVKVLQNYDLYTIDEDLNGRMFETFLNATIRGRELGQYFTPRKIVKFMTKLASLKVKRLDGEIVSDSILDACCGSGGFLIDAMADLAEKVKHTPSLAPYKDEIYDHIKTKTIFGIEANPKISKIARMNMHVHGDGGSKIYCADSLDKKIQIKAGTNKEIKKELEELQDFLITQNKKFDVVLTNPPFSMTYRTKEEGEKEILEQYGNTDETLNLTYEKGTGNLKSSVKSNVLFVARYSELLKDEGRLFIILDNSVLNSFTHKEYRNFIRNNFIIKAVFQLPTHAFVNQEAGGITSILYLEKKGEEKEQSPVFARVIENIGHNESGKEITYDDFDKVLKEYKKYEVEGKLYLEGEKEIGEYQNDTLFLISPEKLNDRLDVFYHQPTYNKLLIKLRAKEKSKDCELKKLSDFSKIPNIDEEDKRKIEAKEPTDEDKVYKYIEISSIDAERGFIINGSWEEGKRKDLADRAKLFIKENDVLFSKPFRSLKKVVIVPEELNGDLASSGFYGIRPVDYEQACLLWAIFRSNLIQKQLWHLCSGYTQRELNDEYLEELIIPIPKNEAKVSKEISANIGKAKQARKEELEAINSILQSPEKAIMD